MTRPLGGGIYTVSAGNGAAWKQQLRWADVLGLESPQNYVELEAAWRISLADLPKARVALLGVPLDTGAGIRRGAAYGPRAIRDELLSNPGFHQVLRSRQLIDLGDVLVNPHLLHDEMLNPKQIRASQNEMYPQLNPTARAKLPVSALSMTKAVLGAVLKQHPHLKIFVMGGDHSVAWPVSEVLHKIHGRALGIAQPDAHTDLLATRLGVKYCFGTWSFHANKLLQKDKPRAKSGARFVQFGIRQTGKERSHWEGLTGVRQFWADEILKRPSSEIIDEAVRSLRAAGVRKLYFSNDIDGTDEAEASATGTPAAGGPSSKFFLELIARLGAEFELVGADLMEVAPDLGSDAGKRQTLALAGQYAWATLEAQLKGPGAPRAQP